MRTPPGRAYQELVAGVMKAFDPTAEIKSGEWIEGPDGRRDMDVSIRGTLDGRQTLAVIECKDFDPATTGKVGIQIIDALDSKRHDLKADITFICSNSGFTEDALNKVRRKGIIAVSVLSEGDERVKLVIKKEVYFRRIQIYPIENIWTQPAPSSMEIGDTAKDITYQGLPVANWLEQKAVALAMAIPGVSEQLKATFRLKEPTEFEVNGKGTIIISKLEIRFTPKTKWFSQIVDIDAGLAMYDYLRGKIRFAGGPNRFLIKDIDFDKGKPLSSPPDLGPTNLLPGEIHVQLAMVEGYAMPDAPKLDELIIPADLTQVWPPHSYPHSML